MVSKHSPYNVLLALFQSERMDMPAEWLLSVDRVLKRTIKHLFGAESLVLLDVFPFFCFMSNLIDYLDNSRM